MAWGRIYAAIVGYWLVVLLALGLMPEPGPVVLSGLLAGPGVAGLVITAYRTRRRD